MCTFQGLQEQAMRRNEALLTLTQLIFVKHYLYEHGLFMLKLLIV